MDTLLSYVLQHEQDAIVWQAKYYLDKAGENVAERANVIDGLAKRLLGFNETARMSYLDVISKKCKVPKKQLQVALSAAAEKARQEAEAREMDLAAMEQEEAPVLTLEDYLEQNAQDAVLWQAGHLLELAGKDVSARASAIDRVARTLTLFKSARQHGYINAISQEFGIPKKTIGAALTGAMEAREQLEEGEPDDYDNIPAWMDKEEILTKGFCTIGDKKSNRFGYYSWSQNGKVQLSNFIIHPVFHVEGSGESSRHIFEIENARKRVLVDMPSKVFVSLDTLNNLLVTKGGFIFHGSRNYLLNVSTVLLDKFPSCMELKQLGWQPEGFFAFVNKVFKPNEKLLEINNWGVIEIDEKNYLIPASSEIYKNLREGEDPYENDRSLKYVQSPISFREWAGMMHQVYGEKGHMAIAFTFITAFADIIYAIDGNCPFLYGYGERNSGKSKWAESISALFFAQPKREPFHLSSGTDNAFFSYVSLFRNCPSILNEFDDKEVRDQWFEAIKGFFEKQGRQRGRADAGYKRTETQKSDGTIILLGQFLSTKNDNSVLTRSCITYFFEREFTDEQDAIYSRLKELEKAGLTSLSTDIMEHRDYVKKQYVKEFREIISVWKRKAPDQVNQRIFSNWCHMSTMWVIMGNVFELPVSAPEFDKYCFEQAVYWSKFVRDTDILSDFWNTVVYLLDQDLIKDGWDFKIITTDKIRLREGNGTEFQKEFGEPKKLLLIRLNNVHKLYEESHQKRHKKEAMNLDNLMHYFKARNYYIGNVKQTNFKKYEYRATEMPPTTPNTPGTVVSRQEPVSTNSSAVVFDYNLLGCNLERFNPNLEQNEELPF